MELELLKVGNIWNLLLILNVRICPPTGCLVWETSQTVTAVHDSRINKHWQPDPSILTLLARLVREPNSSSPVYVLSLN